MIELGLPRTPRFLINTVVLAILLFATYYLPLFSSSLHERLNQAYYANFWQDSQPIQSPEGVALQILWPRFVSSLAGREIVVSLKNNTSVSIEPVIVITPQIESSKTIIPETPPQQWFIWQSELQYRDNGYNGRSILNLGQIPPKGQVTESVWIRVAPAGKPPNEVIFDAYAEWPCSISSPCKLLANPAPAQLSSTQTMLQGIVRVLLLPPLTNLFIPLLALFLALTYEDLLLITRKSPKGHNKNLSNSNEKLRNWFRGNQKYLWGFIGLCILGCSFLYLIISWAIYLLVPEMLSQTVVGIIFTLVLVSILIVLVICVQGHRLDENSELGMLWKEINSSKQLLDNVQQQLSALLTQIINQLENGININYIPFEVPQTQGTISIATQPQTVGEKVDDNGIATTQIQTTSCLNVEPQMQQVNLSDILDALRIIEPQISSFISTIYADAALRNQLTGKLSDFQAILHQVRERHGGPLITTLDNEVAKQYVELCTELSVKDISFTQWFVIDELTQPGKYDELALNAIRDIANAWKGKLDNGEVSNEFKQLIIHTWKEGERPSDILKQIKLDLPKTLGD